MKIIKKIVINLNNNQIIEEDSFDYNGPIAHCGGGKPPDPQTSPGGEIIKQLQGPLVANIQKYILGSGTEQLTNRAIQQGVNASNAQYGLRGLEGSGIAVKGTQEVASDIGLKGAQQQAQNLIGLVGAGAGAPIAPQQPKGIFGLK